jgi:dephospho-CoA kinase
VLCYIKKPEQNMVEQQIKKEPGSLRKNVRVIGLTGGIASGKSSVARFLEERGVTVIDADELSREAVRPGSDCLERIVASFGPDALLPDGSLNRKRLGALVFSNPEKRKTLERIVHPEIRRLAEERIEKAAALGQHNVVYMAPLLIEAGATALVDEIWVVTVTPQVQLERLMARDGIGREEAERVVAAQMPLEQKARYGRILIDNSGTASELLHKLAEIWDQETGEKL